ncbi:MAG: isoquinoline 1-oxidoreductase subunit beta [Actinomycetota bacterium]|jgi:isoquinoline 1-oxidoreductase beta subunit|nr:isoquinoline 1-oxidoreductase subunit beta [Actinomycetota bacterium]
MSALDANIGRRQVLKGFLIAGPTLAIAGRLGFADGAGAFPTKTDEVPDEQDFTDIFIAAETPTLYDLKIEIKPDNRVYAEGPRQDIGQGFLTTFAMQVADHLDVPMANMDVICSPAEQKRGAAQITGGSHNTRALWDPIRIICAQMRGQLMAAGAQKLGVPVSALRTEDAHVIARDGRKVSYGELTALAASLPMARAALPKTAKDFKLIGKPQVKESAHKIVQGKQQYVTDMFPSKEFFPTVVAMAKTHGASVVSIDDSAAKAMKGVIAVTHVPGMADYLIPECVAVTAETFGIAKKAKNALKITWTAGPMDQLSDAQIDDTLNGIIDKVTSPGEGLDATFRWPYVPHAPMEENAGCGRFVDGKYEGWGGAQVPNTLQRQIAETLGIKVEDVTYHVIPAGGAFGRHLFHDQDVLVAQVAQRVGKPIKMQWMREEGIKHGRCRPVSIHHVKATVANNDVVSYEHRMACPEMDLRHGLGDVATGYVTEYNNEGACQYFFTHTQKLFYKTGPTAITLKQRLLAKPTAAWRVVYSGQVHTIDEIVMDELARMAGKDEFQYRMEMLDSDRHRAVLDKCAHEAQWGRKLPAGVAQGIGMHDEYKSIVAYIMEVDTRGKEPRMTRCTIAVDNGFCVNPKGTESSLLGQAMDGFSVVYRAGLHVDNGATRESNFHDYKWSRMFDSAPEMSVHILPSSNVIPGGVGELGVPAASGAAANAWARATGKQVRNFPINEYGA